MSHVVGNDLAQRIVKLQANFPKYGNITRLDNVKSGHFKSGQIKSGQLKSGQVRSRQSGQVKLGQVHSGQGY